MKKKILLFSKPSLDSWQIPYLWATAKTYYEENGLYSDHWEWLDPMIVLKDHETFIDLAVEQNPDVIGFSLYTWNEGTFSYLAEKIREKLPNCHIIFGGPQCDIKYNEKYFRQRPYVDLVVPGDAYGEIIIKEMLDSIVEHKGKIVPDNIPYCYYPDADRNVVYQDKPIDKRNFQWFANPFRAQQEYFSRYLNRDQNALNTWFMLESSRGCPYRCSFCDWGGGTYTKTIKKPFATVLDEIRWSAEQGINGIFVSDANFGLFDIDIEYAKFMVRCKEKYGFPQIVTIQPTKTKMKNLSQIFEILSAGGLLPQYKIAVEDLNEHVLKNIDRVDFPFEEKMDMVDKLRERYDIPVFVEGILGLPGASLETLRLDIDRTISRGVEFPMNHPWVLLPETPAYAPDYRKKWNIQTITDKNGMGTSSLPLKNKDSSTDTQGVTVLDVGHELDLTAEYVVGTSSYSVDDYIKMLAMNQFVNSLHNTSLTNLIGKYLNEKHDLHWGDFYFDIKRFLQEESTLSHYFSQIDHAVEGWIKGNESGMYIDYAEDFKYLIHPNNYVLFLALVYPDEFYGSIAKYFNEKFNDETIFELCDYAKFSVVNIDYEINNTKTFIHNWKEWTAGATLEKQTSTYVTKDETIRVGPKHYPIDWQEKKGTPDYLTHFFYRVCYTNLAKKDVKNIERI